MWRIIDLIDTLDFQQTVSKVTTTCSKGEMNKPHTTTNYNPLCVCDTIKYIRFDCDYRRASSPGASLLPGELGSVATCICTVGGV